MSVLERAIGWLAPPQCIKCGAEGAVLCGGCSAGLPAFGQHCWRCNRLSPGCRTCETCRHSGSPTHVYIFTDHDGLARSLLSAYKFGHQRAAAPVIARLMAGALTLPSKDYLLVPVPTATGRVRQRGFDHAALLVKHIAHELKMPSAHVLRRLGQSRQLGARREDRLRQLGSSFAVKTPGLIAGRRILLIDDVVTTGGTLVAAARVLRAAGAAQVDALVFAKRL